MALKCDRKTCNHRCHSAEYKTWCDMIKRCENTKAQNYYLYGGRGITICPEWRKSFESFLEDVGKKPSPEHSLDRIDHNGNYEPQNIRWATRLEQANNKRNNRFVEYKGESLTLPQWGRRYGIKSSTIRQRYYTHKWSIEKCLGGY